MKHALKTSIIALALVGTAGTLSAWNTNTNTIANTGSAITEAAVESVSASRVYDIDPTHTNVIFKIRHGSVSNFYGRFNDTQGTINFDKGNFENSSMDVTVQISSIDTHNRTRDGHLKGADFLNVRQYGEATFKSTGIEAAGEGLYTLTGDFTLSGKTVEIEAEVRDVRTGKFNNFDVLGVEARFTIKRSDFGIVKYLDKSNPDSGPLGDDIEIIVAIEAVGK